MLLQKLNGFIFWQRPNLHMYSRIEKRTFPIFKHLRHQVGLAAEKEVTDPLLLLYDRTQQSLYPLIVESCYFLKLIKHNNHLSILLDELLWNIENLGKCGMRNVLLVEIN